MKIQVSYLIVKTVADVAREVLKKFCGQIHQIPKPRNPWTPNHDDSPPVGGHLLNP